MRYCISAVVTRCGVFALLCALSFVHAADVPTGQALEKLMQQPSDHARTEKIVKLYDSLFGNADMKQLSSMEKHHNASIALRAAWEKVRRTMSEKDKTKAQKIDPRAVRQFVAFVEEYLDFRVPAFWKHDLIESRYWSRRILITGDPDIQKHLAMYDESTVTTIADVRVRSMAGMGLTAAKNRLVIDINERRCSVPVELLKHAAGGGGGTVDLNASLASADRLILALHANFADEYPLYSLSCKDGSKDWEAEVWCQPLLFGGGSGIHTHRVSLVVKNGKVYVFGACVHSAYIEAFSTQSGANLFRFSTAM